MEACSVFRSCPPIEEFSSSLLPHVISLFIFFLSWQAVAKSPCFVIKRSNPRVKTTKSGFCVTTAQPWGLLFLATRPPCVFSPAEPRRTHSGRCSAGPETGVGRRPGSYLGGRCGQMPSLAAFFSGQLPRRDSGEAGVLENLGMLREEWVGGSRCAGCPRGDIVKRRRCQRSTALAGEVILAAGWRTCAGQIPTAVGDYRGMSASPDALIGRHTDLGQGCASRGR